MTRVAFLLAERSDKWVGGYNYFLNLLIALSRVPDLRFEPVVLTANPNDQALVRAATGFEVNIVPALARDTLPGLCRLAQRGLLGSDTLVERALRRNRIDIVSHASALPRRFGVTTIGWIPDFQHRWLKEMFSEREIISRDRDFVRLCDRSASLIVSSHVARMDLERFFCQCAARVHTLRFVSGLAAHPPTIADMELRDRYDLQPRFFYMPNQFWAHKNHVVVIEALRILKDHRADVQVVCSGSRHDYRQPKHFDVLWQRAIAYGVQNSFKILGVIPYADVSALMRGSVAVLNPSLFEGWSTSIEEAKSLGKRVIASDIAVHREQNPERSAFFRPDDAEGLAQTLCDVLDEHNEDNEMAAMGKAQAELPVRVQTFARDYEGIVLDTIRTLANC